ADRVAGAMDEPVAEASLLDHVAGRPIDLPALKLLLLGKGIFDALDRRVAPGGHDVEDLDVAIGDGVADEGGPGEIAVDGAGLIELAPEIDEDEIADANL